MKDKNCFYIMFVYLMSKQYPICQELMDFISLYLYLKVAPDVYLKITEEMRFVLEIIARNRTNLV